MERFTQLFCELDGTMRTNEKLAALQSYFSAAHPASAAWALHFLIGGKMSRVISTRLLRDWTAAESHLPLWLVAECQEAVGDFGETLALLLPGNPTGTNLSLDRLVQERLLPLQSLPPVSRHDLLVQTWRELNGAQRLVWNKLITGEFRVGVARTLMVRALAGVAGVAAAVMAHRLMGPWKPVPEDFSRLMSGENSSQEPARPYPFYLASPLENPIEVLGDFHEWLAEWKWDGIRTQLIRRQGESMIWSRGDDMVTRSFPEIAEAGAALPEGTVLDGEILAWQAGRPLPFAALQRRLGRKATTKDLLSEFPIHFLGYDLLEFNGKDMRALPLSERRQQLESLIGRLSPSLPMRLSEKINFSSWDHLAELQRSSRERGVEGVMLKRWSSPYGVGRQRGHWWKWKIDPFHIDAVLMYAQRGHGRRASLYTDYTFGLWHEGNLVPVAKAYSGLSDDEIHQVDRFVRQNTVDKFGPVRVVKPELVFELAFEGIQLSGRHKSGIAVRFPRMNRWRRDKKPAEADTLETLRAMGRMGKATIG